MTHQLTRITVEVPASLASVIDQIALERGSTRANLLRNALGIIKAMHEGAKEGLYAGLVRDKRKLDTLLVGPL